jgi:hypothetical protein
VCFANDGIFSCRNDELWGSGNPHALGIVSHQQHLSVNIRSGVVAMKLVGLYELPARLDGQTSCQCLQDALRVPLEVGPISTLWFMCHDDAPAHYTLWM